ncbi:MAG: SLBB domain-containing protein, partial [Smithellaceae bacterium]|nr:SLBB domain-containing protein [Smithellaceae bacterium]
GKYPLKKNMRVKDVLLMAGGPNPNAYPGAAQIFRTNPESRNVTILMVDITQALAESSQDNIVMQDKDRLVVAHIQEFKPETTVSITGEVHRPGEYTLAAGMTVRDLIYAAGNIRESGYLDEAELTSMITQGTRSTQYEHQNVNLSKALSGDIHQNHLLRPYDRLLVKRIPGWRQEKHVTIEGEIRFPSRYAIRNGERLSSLIERAGGYTPMAYLRAANFTREKVREMQQKGILEMADRLERDLLAGSAGQLSTSLSAEEIAGKKVEAEQRQKFVQSIRELKATGRMTVQLSHLHLLKGSAMDIELDEGDRLVIPPKNSVVNIAGGVMTQASLIYSDKMSYGDYIEAVGGYSRFADKNNVFVMKVDGSARKLARGFFDWSNMRGRWEIAGSGEQIRTIEPGDTIVVPEKLDRIAWLREIRDITQVLMNVAVTAAVVLRLF